MSVKLLVSRNGNGDGAEVRGKEMVDKRNIFHSQDSHTHTHTHTHTQTKALEFHRFCAFSQLLEAGKGLKDLKTDYVDIDSPSNFREDSVSI